MAKRKSTLAASTATVPSWTESVAINTGRPYNENNPHSWLRLRGSPAGATGIRVLHGTLRLHLGDHPQRLSAEAFCLRKCRPVESPDALAITALRAEVLVPQGIDDAYADPLLLPRLIDHSLARETTGSTAILCYCTITDPHTQHLHEQWSTGRQIVANLVARFAVPMLLVQHAPQHAGSGNAPHLHVMAAVRKLSPRGFGAQVPQLIGDKARDVFVAAWRGAAKG